MFHWLHLLWNCNFSTLACLSSKSFLRLSRYLIYSYRTSCVQALCRVLVPPLQHDGSRRATQLNASRSFFNAFARPRIQVVAEVQARHWRGRFECDHLPCFCGQLFVWVFPLRATISHRAICNQAESQDAHTQEHTWLILIRQNSPRPSSHRPRGPEQNVGSPVAAQKPEAVKEKLPFNSFTNRENEGRRKWNQKQSHSNGSGDMMHEVQNKSGKEWV